MMISSTFYNEAGELMAPLPLDLKRQNVTPGGTPTVEAGFYHRFKFEGRTEKEREVKYRRFFSEMNAIPGYMTLAQRAYTVQMGSFVRYGVDVTYVVESAAQAAEAARRAIARRAQPQMAPQPNTANAFRR